jgi:hypothetical protein
MKNFSLALGVATLVAILAGCTGSNAGSQLPSPGAMQLTAYHHSDSGPRHSGPNGNPSRWVMYYYCGASDICPKTASDFYNLVTFYLTPKRYTALLVTKDPTLVGDLTGTTLSDAVNVTVNHKTTQFGNFEYQGSPSCGGGGAAPNARFFFTTGGLFEYTHYWWSNPTSWTLAENAPTTISQVVDSPGEWSDWNGQLGSSEMKKFDSAIKNVTMVGLSFGGGCFFENGVNVTGPKNAIFNSTFTE